MRFSNVVLPLSFILPALATKDTWAFGNGFYSGPASGAHITKATWSIVPPNVPTGYSVSDKSDEIWVSLWIGLQHTAGETSSYLYQPLLNWSPDQESQGCTADADQWCVAASTYTPDGQNGQAYVAVAKDATVDFEVTVNSGEVTQVVTIDGKVVSKETDKLDAEILYLYSGNECYTGSGSCGNLEAYSWNNITIELNAADKAYGETLSLYSGTSSNDGFTTSDNGKTWHADAIKVSEDTFPNEEYVGSVTK